MESLPYEGRREDTLSHTAQSLNVPCSIGLKLIRCNVLS